MQAMQTYQPWWKQQPYLLPNGSSSDCDRSHLENLYCHLEESHTTLGEVRRNAGVEAQDDNPPDVNRKEVLVASVTGVDGARMDSPGKALDPRHIVRFNVG